MDIVAFCFVALFASVAALSLKKYTPDISAIITIGAGILIFASVLGKILPIIEELRILINSAGAAAEYGSILIKTIGICFLCQFTSDACRDAGQASLATRVELAGRVAILIIALPMFEKIMSVAVTLIGST